METSLIEKLEKTRYNLLKWLTIGWGIWFGTFILKNLLQNQLILQFATWIGLLGWVIFSINLVKYFKLKRELKWDKKLERALNDELHQLNMFQSFFIGYCIIILVTGILFVLSLYITLPAVLVTEIILYIGVLSVLISGLIYNRD